MEGVGLRPPGLIKFILFVMAEDNTYTPNPKYWKHNKFEAVNLTHYDTARRQVMWDYLFNYDAMISTTDESHRANLKELKPPTIYRENAEQKLRRSVLRMQILLWLEKREYIHPSRKNKNASLSEYLQALMTEYNK